MKGFLLVLLLIAIVSCVEVVNETEKFDWSSILGFLLPLLKQFGVPYIVSWCDKIGLAAVCQSIIDALLKMLGA